LRPQHSRPPRNRCKIHAVSLDLSDEYDDSSLRKRETNEPTNNRFRARLRNRSAKRKQIAQTELSRIDEALPPLQDIVDPDDRFYVANIWRHVDHAWIPRFLAVAAIEEEGSEKVRSECMEGIIAMTPDLATTTRNLHAFFLAASRQPHLPPFKVNAVRFRVR
jgi:hypothetical protein